MRFVALVCVLLISTSPGLWAQEPALAARKSIIKLIRGVTGPQVVERSIAYHDPQGQWGERPVSFRLFESRPGITPENGGNYRITDLAIDISGESFTLDQQRGANRVYRAVGSDTCVHKFNSDTNFSDEVRNSFQLTCSLSQRLRDYYTYLWGLPMKLGDEGTQIADEVHLADYFGTQLLQVRVTYDVEVGNDTWYFYFSPDNYALRGYRFYHDESGNDGEYILIKEEARVGDLLLPQSRSWYRHVDGVFLGEDRIIFN